jgi:hypothetical protein
MRIPMVDVCPYQGQIRNEVICERVGFVPIDDKLVQHRLRWFGHIQQYGNYEGQRTTKVDMDGGGKKGLEGLECT